MNNWWVAGWSRRKARNAALGRGEVLCESRKATDAMALGSRRMPGASRAAMTTDHGRPPPSPIRGNPVPTWKALCRKVRVLATTTPRSIAVPASTDEFVARCDRLARAAADQRFLDQKILALWQLEGLAFAFFEGQEDDRFRVVDLDLPPAAGPPVHCGIAMATVLKHGFEADRLLDQLEAVVDPAFAPFAIETVGLMLAVYEPDLFGVATSVLGRVGVVRHTRLRRPPIPSFLESVPRTHWPHLAHGYGRALYFKRFSFAGAVRSAQRQNGLPVAATARGVTAAFTLINSRDLERVLRLRGDDSNVELTDGIRGGMMNSLVLLEWTFPGCLRSACAVPDDGSRLIGEAEDRAATARRQGLGPPLVA